MIFIWQQISFYFSIFLALFVPGYFLLRAAFGKNFFSKIEMLVFSFVASIISIDFFIILIDNLGIPINKTSSLFVIATISIASFLVEKKRFSSNPEPEKKHISFSKNQTIAIVLILFLTFFIKSVHLEKAIFPTATDLGHHMYWSKLISETGHLSEYEKINIIQSNGSYAISQPDPIADFIIGEHIIFSVINLISGVDFVSYFPTILLFLINIMGNLAVFILALMLLEKMSAKDNRFKKNVAIMTLLFLGPLYAISSPQSSFASGGVIGNVLGNMLIPISIYFFLRALSEKSPALFSGAIFATAGMFYTHHLSTFIFIFVFAFTFIIFNLIFLYQIIAFEDKKNIFETVTKKYKSLILSWIKLIFSAPAMSLIIFFALFFFFVYTPSYIEPSAVGTAVGTPSKSTRTGLTLKQLSESTGDPRIVFGIIGALILAVEMASKKSLNRNIYASAFTLGWFFSIFIPVLKPNWLYLDLPSGRIANYFAFPASLMASYALIWILSFPKNTSKTFFIPPQLLTITFLTLIIFTITDGMRDNSQSLSKKPNIQEANQTYHAAKYLAENHEFTKDDIVLKDHNYLKADTWMKIFFMRDYNFPFSRGYFKRYEDTTKPREMCSLWMISVPASENGQKCYQGTGTDFVIVNPEFDSIQFDKSEQFFKVYSSNDTAVYYKFK